MRDPEAILRDACRAMIRGEPEACQAALEIFHKEISASPPDDALRAACESQLSRLRELAQAALEGLDQTRSWMRDLSAVLGGLDVYDRAGRHRVGTDLSARTHRF